MKALLLLITFVTLSWGIPGGWRKLDTDSEEAKEISSFATETLSNRMNSPFHSKVVSILSARRQVVAGLLYNMTIEVSETSCKKNDVNYSDIEQCDLLDPKRSQICDVTVWVKKWMNFQKLQSFSCKPAKPKKF